MLTQALYSAREEAMSRFQSDSGVLSIAMTQDSHVWGHPAIEFAAVDTSVTRTTGPEEIYAREFGISAEDVREDFMTNLPR